MLCQVCESEEAAWTLIPIGEGLPQSIGNGCFARFGLAAAKELLPAEEIAETLGPMFVGPATAARELDSTPKRSATPGRRKAKLGAQPEPAGDPPEGAEVEAAE
jgi:hypothetical protein